MEIELPDADGGNVISISIAKHTSRYARRLWKECPHDGIDIDPTLDTLYCRDCGKDVNPVQWLAMMVEEWHRVKALYEKHRQMAEKVEERSKVKCRHCGKFTPTR